MDLNMPAFYTNIPSLEKLPEEIPPSDAWQPQDKVWGGFFFFFSFCDLSTGAQLQKMEQSLVYEKIKRCAFNFVLLRLVF